METRLSHLRLFNARKGRLGRKAEVQAFVPLVSGGSEIVVLFFRRHRVPFIPSLLVHALVEYLRPNEEHEIVGANSQENLVSPTIERLIVVAVDLASMSIDIQKWNVGSNSHWHQ